MSYLRKSLVRRRVKREELARLRLTQIHDRGMLKPRVSNKKTPGPRAYPLKWYQRW